MLTAVGVEARAVAREINERIRALAGSYDTARDPLDFLCECGCFTWVRLTAADYDALGERPVLASGHSLAETA